jgi:septal ring factor EnvC (AmiA/AmiB activator)
MITLDQVLLLEQKVESAVAKIQQLEAENDALRNKCSELTNALSAKSEQLSSFETDQNKIEQGIRKALDRLNTIENSVLKAAGQLQGNTQPQVTAKPVAAVAPSTQSFETMKPVVQEAPVQPVVEETVPEQEEEEEDLEPESKPQPSFQPTYEEQQYEESSDDSAEASSETPVEDNFDSEYSGDFEEDNSQDNLGFDIF